MRKLLHTLVTLLLVLLGFSESYAQLSNVTVDPGPYTYGSSIAASFTIGSTCIPITNNFDLYLSDATGDFSNEIPIGRYVGFYTTFVNGTIPNFTPPIAPGTGYRVRVKLTSDPLVVSLPSNAFEIKAGTAVNAAVTSSNATLSTLPQVAFGFCTNRTGTAARINFTNTSTSGGITTINIKNEMDVVPDVPLTFVTSTQTFTPGAAHYTMTVKVVMPDGTIATRDYFIVNNPANTSFATSGSGLVCLPGGALSYDVDTDRPTGIQKNFPGNTYRVSWGDDSADLYTLCQIIQLGSQVRHTYLKSSCGSNFNGQYNVFPIEISTQSPFETCGRIGQPLSTFARVVTVTENKFTGPLVACTNANATFVNTSLLGQAQNGNELDCTDNSVTFNWYIDGQLVLSNVPKSTNLIRSFPNPGTYEIKIESVGSGACQGDPYVKTICVQSPPAPAFTLSSNTVCLTAGTTTANSSTSVLNNTCSTTPVYTWTVSPSTGVSFTQGDPNPVFTFSQIGSYDITLTIQTVGSTPATCEVTTASQHVVVNGPPKADLSGPKNLCSLGNYTFGPAATDTKTVISGNAEDLPGTYTWVVTGGPATFVAPSTANSKYPTINFSAFGTYTVTLTYANNCNPNLTVSQQITFTESPVPTITAPSQVCYGAAINLQGAIANSTSNTTFTWSSTGGGTFSPANSLTTTYTPTAAELSAGTTRIRLLVSTGLLGACAQVEANTPPITILPDNTGTNATQTICSGNSTSYVPSSTVAASTFTWTAVNADGNAVAGTFSPTGTGPINETITNSNATANAVVVYTITPTSPQGCVGRSFTFTATVTPRPIISAIPANLVICTRSAAAITISSNLTGTRYTWTNTATGGITGASTITVPTTASQINDLLVNPGTTQGSVTYIITPYSANNCAGTPFNVTINVDPGVTIANAGPDESICDITSYTLNGNVPVVGTGLWTLVTTQTGVNITNPSQYNTTVTGLVGGQVYTFRWTISAPGACAATTDDINVTVNTPSVAGLISGDATVCQNNNNGTITLTGNTGLITNWESSVDGGTTWTTVANTTASLSYSNLTVTTLYRATVKNGSCEAKTTNTVTITVTPASTPAAAGANQTLCNQTTVLLDGNIPAVGETGLWTITTGTPNANITDPSNPKTTVTGLTTGQTYIFKWTITGTSACGPTSSEVTVTNLPPLTNTISSTSTEVCNGQQITITGSTPTGGTGTYTYLWESSADGTNWTTITGETGKDLNYTLTTTLNFRRTVISSTCTLISNVQLIVAQPPITNNTIAADQTICTGNIPVALTGSTPSGSDGNFNYQWQSSTDNINWTNISGAVFTGYQPLALTATTYFRRVVSTITCNGSLRSFSAAVTITVKPNAKAEFTYATDNGCTPFVIDANNIKAVAYPDRNATYTWYADNVVIGTGIAFPGYTIATSNTRVTIKLIVSPSTGCLADEMSHDFSTNQATTAAFTQSTTNGCGPLTVSFVNTSSSLTTGTFRWDFGNGTTSTQVMPGPVTYLPDPTGKDTTYTVTLTATTSCGANSITSTVFVKAKPLAVFSPSRTTGCSPLKVTFTNTSPGGTNTYYYDFGDGTLLTKTDKSDVEHTFTTNVVKDFVVTMIAENECGRDQRSYTIRVSPNTVLPELVVNANEKEGCAPLQVNFYNNSRGANLFKYDFGDGTTQITRSAPEVVTHTFDRPGTYTIILTASNGCSDTTTTESVTVLPQPLATFTADNLLGCPGLVVQFKNTSTDGISYLWDFGDGTTSAEFEPKHVFNGDKEFYTVSLTATNSLGCTYTAIMNQYIHIVVPPVARFNVAPSTLISIPNYTFRFEDESTGSPTIWEWDFGDGIKSTQRNPSHTYLDTGKYVVTLKVSNQQGCFTTTFKTVTIVGVPGYLYVPNSFMPGSETPELRVFMAKGSGIKTWTMSIFNKWGQTLWQTSKLDDGRPVEWWDGVFNSVPVPQGVYFWKIDVEFINGTAWKGMTYDNKAPKKTGVIHLLR